jgi:hypothetical protein
MIENYDHAMELHKIGVHIKYMEEKMDFIAKMAYDNQNAIDKQREMMFVGYCVCCIMIAILFLFIVYGK